MAILASAALGTTAINVLYAQNKSPGAYVIVDINAFNNAEEFKTLIPKLGPANAAFGVKPIVQTETAVGLDGTAPKRFAIIPFDSVDNDPVFVLVMLVSPQERPSDHLRALEGVSRCLKDKDFVQSLRKATSAQEIWDLICKHDRGA